MSAKQVRPVAIKMRQKRIGRFDPNKLFKLPTSEHTSEKVLSVLR